jgi:hypothetical protein
MEFGKTAVIGAISKFEDAQRTLRQEIVDEVADAIVASAAGIAPDEDDFKDAVHAEGEDGDHALIAVEDELARWMERNPAAVDVFRDSVEWDIDTRGDDDSRAALAAVNEAYKEAEARWDGRERAASARP